MQDKTHACQGLCKIRQVSCKRRFVLDKTHARLRFMQDNHACQGLCKIRQVSCKRSFMQNIPRQNTCNIRFMQDSCMTCMHDKSKLMQNKTRPMQDSSKIHKIHERFDNTRLMQDTTRLMQDEIRLIQDKPSYMQDKVHARYKTHVR